MFLRPNILKSRCILIKQFIIRNSSHLGSGAGKGGGGGGHIRNAGGGLGEMGAVREEEYFRRKQTDQLDELREKLKKEINFHEQQIKKKKKNIKQAEQEIDELE